MEFVVRMAGEFMISLSLYCTRSRRRATGALLYVPE